MVDLEHEFDPDAPRLMEHDGVQAEVQFNAATWRLEGRSTNTAMTITFSGKSVEELWTSFRAQVEVYKDAAASLGYRFEKPYSGKYPLKMSPDLHRRADMEARRRGVVLATFIRTAIEKALK